MESFYRWLNPKIQNSCGYFYSTMQQTIQPLGVILFDSSGITSQTVLLNNDSILFESSAEFIVDYYVSTSNDSSFGLILNNAIVSGSLIQCSANNSCSGSILLYANKGDKLSLINMSSESATNITVLGGEVLDGVKNASIRLAQII